MQKAQWFPKEWCFGIKLDLLKTRGFVPNLFLFRKGAFLGKASDSPVVFLVPSCGEGSSLRKRRMEKQKWAEKTHKLERGTCRAQART
ncbi:hypothetical protein D5086_016468 [Populus alba]|uniref:Uncharacterized protein n=1 Tax=Populus alba TaxID=43335 RepID=A0ACC4BVB4_POPAL